MSAAQPVDVDGSAVYVGDRCEPVHRSPASRGALVIVAFYGDDALLSDGLTIATAKLRWAP